MVHTQKKTIKVKKGNENENEVSSSPYVDPSVKSREIICLRRTTQTTSKQALPPFNALFMENRRGRRWSVWGAAELCVQYCLWCPLCIIHDCCSVPVVNILYLYVQVSFSAAGQCPLGESPGGIQFRSPHQVYQSIEISNSIIWEMDNVLIGQFLIFDQRQILVQSILAYISTHYCFLFWSDIFFETFFAQFI